MAAALGVAILIWVISVPLQRAVGPGVEAAIAEIGDLASPPGVPGGSTAVPVLFLLDGRELRLGDPHSRVVALLPERLAAGPPHLSTNEFGERHTRTYVLQGTRLSIVCERTEQGGPMKVSGIYLP
jgi:hypothetical protein